MRCSFFVALLVNCFLAAASVFAVEIAPWSGAVTTNSATVKVKMPAANSGAELLVSTSADLSDPIVVAPEASHATSQVASFRLSGLNPDTQYYFAVRQGETVYDAPDQKGQFRTFAENPQTFSFVFGACARTGSNHIVFEKIRQRQPLFFMNIGDLHYENIGANDPDRFRKAYDRVFSAPRQNALYRNIPLAYVWDDHDFGPNNSHRHAPGREASRATYREYIPHYPLAFDQTDAPIDQAFTVGRVRFILSDLRSERDPEKVKDGPDKRMMNEEQLAWFKAQILEAKAAGQAIFWVSSVPWINKPGLTGDNWGGFRRQRGEIANFFAENQIDNLTILCGDAHMLAADDGTNANYSSDPNAPPIRVLHSAALDRGGSTKGGPYSHGTFPNSKTEGLHGQYAVVTVTDLGDELQIDFAGYRVGQTGEETELLSMSWTMPVGQTGE